MVWSRLATASPSLTPKFCSNVYIQLLTCRSMVLFILSRTDTSDDRYHGPNFILNECVRVLGRLNILSLYLSEKSLHFSVSSETEEPTKPGDFSLTSRFLSVTPHFAVMETSSPGTSGLRGIHNEKGCEEQIE